MVNGKLDAALHPAITLSPIEILDMRGWLFSSSLFFF